MIKLPLRSNRTRVPLKRLVFCAGPWQLITAAATLRLDSRLRCHDDAIDILLYYGRTESPDEWQQLRQLAEKTWSWNAVFDVYNQLHTSAGYRNSTSALRAMLFKEGYSGNEEIWLLKLYSNFDKGVLATWRDCPVVLYEDGLDMYLQRDLTCGWDSWRRAPCHNWLGRIKREWSHLCNETECELLPGVCQHDLRRIRCVYRLIGSRVACPDYMRHLHLVDVPKDDVLHIVKAVEQRNSGLVQYYNRLKKPRVLVATQPFDVLGWMPAGYEQYFMSAVVRELIHAGYSVIYRKHPRLRKASWWMDDLEQYPADCFALMDSGVVSCLELDPVASELDAVVAVSSSTLFYMNMLYGVPSYTVAGRVAAWTDPTAAGLARLCTFGDLVSFDEMPLANRATESTRDIQSHLVL